MSLENILAVVGAGSPKRRWRDRSTSTGCRAHIAVIMDGNGRWAAQRHLPRVEGHRAGIESVRDVVEGSARLGIKVLTLYAFSVENWKRPVTEVSTLMMLLKRYLRLELNTLLRNNIRFRVIGRDGGARARRAAASCATPRSRPRHNRGMLFNIALNYGGRAEIVEAARRADRRGLTPAELDEQRFARLSLHRRPARSGSPDPHQRRDARQQLPAVADRLRGDLGHRYAVAGLPQARTCSKRSSRIRSAIGATAASTSRRWPAVSRASIAGRPARR